jgi:putative FmdB family regulatory protein
MPLYSFKCTGDCERVIEEIRKVDERNDMMTCPTCGGDMVHTPSVPGPPQGGPTPRFYR